MRNPATVASQTCVGGFEIRLRESIDAYGNDIAPVTNGFDHVMGADDRVIMAFLLPSLSSPFMLAPYSPNDAPPAV
ncbi:hypothetical protein, partial [Shinella sedimenti]